jgi:signal transduction histidine kinase
MVNTSLIQSRALLARQQLLHQQQHKRLARKIHDDISQKLTLLSLQLSLALADSKPPANWEQQCKQWSAAVLDIGQSLRDIINELQPRILDDFGLTAALQWYVQSAPKGLECQLHLPKEPVLLAPSAANELFSVTRDIISEVFAPNGVTRTAIQIEQSPDVIRLHLRAGEAGAIQEPAASQALDALSVHERLFCVDGSAELHQTPGKGLSITLSMPVNRQPVSHAA